MIRRLLICGGGTGGHIYPGVAVAEEVVAREPSARVVFIGSKKGLENSIIPKAGYDLEIIAVSRLKGGGWLERLKGLFLIPIGMFQSWRVMRRTKPQVVLGVGGYASGPALLAAWVTRRRLAIQEQNARPGMTNRFLGRLARAIYVGFEASGRFFERKDRLVVTGNPLRRAVADALSGATHRVVAKPGSLRVLIFGGSQGARFLNEQVPATLAELRAAHPEVELTIVHQTGPADEEVTRQRYAEAGLGSVATVKHFIFDMPAAYTLADVAICRAGALTLAELTAVGLPSVLVPFPFAADNHQEDNARVLVEAGAAVMYRQADWSSEAVAGWLAEVAAAPARLEQMSRAARGLARLDAARTLVDHLEGVAA